MNRVYILFRSFLCSLQSLETHILFRMFNKFNYHLSTVSCEMCLYISNIFIFTSNKERDDDIVSSSLSHTFYDSDERRQNVIKIHLRCSMQVVYECLFQIVNLIIFSIYSLYILIFSILILFILFLVVVYFKHFHFRYQCRF